MKADRHLTARILSPSLSLPEASAAPPAVICSGRVSYNYRD